MARRKKDPTIGDVIFVLGAFIFIGYFLLKWFIEAIAFLIAGIVWIISKIAELLEKKHATTNINKKTTIKNNKLTEKEIKEELKVFDISVYDNYFQPQIRNRGEKYYLNNKISDFKQNENKYSCKVDGTEIYNTTVTFDKENDNIVESATCTCPYFEDKQEYCKHIYALILKAKGDKNNQILISEIQNYIKGIKEALNNANDYIKNNALSFEDKVRNSYFEYANNVSIQIDNFNKQVINSKNEEDILMDILKQLMNLSEELSRKIRITINSKKTPSSTAQYVPKTKKQSSVGSALIGLALLDSLNSSKEDDDIDEELETEMNAYNLEDWQKDLVRQGRYNPWNFEEDGELEEDDYYYEDDK